MLHRLADRRSLRRISQQIHGGHRCIFRHAVARPNRNAIVQHGAHRVRIGRCTADADIPQVVPEQLFRRLSFGQLREPLLHPAQPLIQKFQHHRNQYRKGRLIALHVLEQIQMRRRKQHISAVKERGERALGHAKGVRYRQNTQKALICGIVANGNRIHNIADNIMLTEHHAFCLSRRTRRKYHRAQRVRLCRAVVSEYIFGRLVLYGLCQRNHQLALLAQRISQRLLHGIIYDARDVRPIDIADNRFLRQPLVQQNRHIARNHGSQVRGNPIRRRVYIHAHVLDAVVFQPSRNLHRFFDDLPSGFGEIGISDGIAHQVRRVFALVLILLSRQFPKGFHCKFLPCPRSSLPAS